MNVKDLKNLLENYPDDLEIVTRDDDCEYRCFDIDNIDTVEVFIDRQNNAIDWYFDKPKNARVKTLLVIN